MHTTQLARIDISSDSSAEDQIALCQNSVEQYLEALKTNKASQAAGKVAKATGLDRKALYARALELRAE